MEYAFQEAIDGLLRISLIFLLLLPVVGLAAGMRTICWHAGHRMALPASSALTLSCFPHRHVTRDNIGKPSLGDR